jgi:hypothetical protein
MLSKARRSISLFETSKAGGRRPLFGLHNPSSFTNMESRPKYWRRLISDQKSNPWKELELRQLFERLATSRSKQSIYIIDGLDQCDGSLSKLVQSFSTIMDRLQGLRMKLLVLSRPRPIILLLPTTLPNLAQIDLDEEPEQRRQIDCFIRSEVEQLVSRRTGFERFRSRIIKQLNERAQGMYLLLAVVSHDLLNLRNSTSASIEATLDCLPRSLFAAYRQVLDNVQEEDRLLVGKVLMWALFGIRPLSIQELSVAVAIDLNMVLQSEIENNTRLDILGDGGICQVLGPLLKVNSKGKVQLIHHSSVEFFLPAKDKDPQSNIQPPD